MAHAVTLEQLRRLASKIAAIDSRNADSPHRDGVVTALCQSAHMEIAGILGDDADLIYAEEIE